MSEHNQPGKTINLLAEQLISFSQAAKLFPSYRLGRPVGAPCVWRWSKYGVRIGRETIIRLEAVRVAGRHLTSVEAVRRFIEAQQINTSAIASRAIAEKTARSETKRTNDSELAIQALQRISNRSAKTAVDRH